MMSNPDDAIEVYLNDHLAGSAAAIELVTEMRSNNEASTLGDLLTWLQGEIESDKASLESLMQHLDAGSSTVKQVGAAAAEKLGRLRFSERVTGSSALSRLLEMETLSVGISGKLGLWRALHEVAPSRPELVAAELEHLADRARQQLDELEPHRLVAAREALGTI